MAQYAQPVRGRRKRQVLGELSVVSIPEKSWRETQAFAARVRDVGLEIDLPYVATTCDIGNTDPMVNVDGKPFVETHFKWLEPQFRYWEDRSAALHSPFLKGARLISEPFYYSNGALATWRASGLLARVDCSRMRGTETNYEAIIAPVHLPCGIIGAVFWAGWPKGGVASVFEKHAAELQACATRFLSAYAEVAGILKPETGRLALTRREVQCLKWAAAGKTNSEIAVIMDLSESTVRFHLRNASTKLGANGRGGAIQSAIGLGFVGAGQTRRRT